MFPANLRGFVLTALLSVCGCFLSVGRACDVPVFRYALENWRASPYRVLAIHRGLPSASSREALDVLRDAESSATQVGNLEVASVDLDDGRFPALIARWRRAGGPEPPCLILSYPSGQSQGGAFWSAPLTAPNARAAVDSPARREVAERLLGGQVAVWVLVACGRPEIDTGAEKRLQTLLDELTEGEVDDGETDRPSPFSVLTLSATDPAERVFREMLLHSEPDLDGLRSEPIAIPIYGRGRALHALVGRGITSRNVREACEFLTGSCSCEAKAQNPGTDLLMAVDWEAELAERGGFAPSAGMWAALPGANGPAIDAQEPRAAWRRNGLLALGALFLLALCAGILLFRGAKKGIQ